MIFTVCHTVQHVTAQHRTQQQSTLHCTGQHCTALCTALQYTAQHSLAQHSAFSTSALCRQLCCDHSLTRPCDYNFCPLSCPADPGNLSSLHNCVVVPMHASGAAPTERVPAAALVPPSNFSSVSPGALGPSAGPGPLHDPRLHAAPGAVLELVATTTAAMAGAFEVSSLGCTGCTAGDCGAQHGP